MLGLVTGARGPLLFAGAVARDPAMRRLVDEGYDGPVLVVAEPQLVGAHGAALHGLTGGRGRARGGGA
ncbi:MAG: hypothetical protein FJ000_03685 [Actinobacteria bacterium]|nr:hypothetical protein [Actinomycetota bacterium]